MTEESHAQAMRQPVSANEIERDEFSEFRWTGFMDKVDKAMDLLWAVLPYVAFFAAGVAFAAALGLFR